MDLETAVIVLIVFFIAAFSKGITGLGFSTTALPFLVVFLGLKETLPFLLIPSIASNLIVMRQAGEFRSTLIRFWPMFAITLIGVVIGLAILDWLPGTTAAAFLGLVLMLYCIFAVARPDFTLSDKLAKLLMLPSGLITGTINGFTGSQVMPLLPYMLSLKLSADSLLQGVNISFTLSSLVMIAGLWHLQLFTGAVLLISLIGLIPVYVGVSLGGRVRAKLSPDSFRIALITILFLMGASMAIKPLL